MRREYTTRSGVTLILRPVPWLAFQRLEIEWEKKRPRVPVVQVEIGDGQFREEENPDSPEYQEALTQWENQKGTAVSEYFFIAGIANKPDEEFLELHREVFPEATDNQLKAMWVSSVVEPDEAGDLIDSIMSQTMATEKGIAEAKASFPGANDQRDASEPVPVSKSPRSKRS